MVVKKVLKWVGIAFLGLFIIGILFGLSGKEPPTNYNPSTPQKEYLNITFSQFNNLFGTQGALTDAQKKIEFESKYKGKYVRWTCEMVELSESFRMSMKCDPSTFTSDLSIKIRDDQKGIAINIPKESQVTFETRLTDYSELWGQSADDGVIISYK